MIRPLSKQQLLLGAALFALTAAPAIAQQQPQQDPGTTQNTGTGTTNAPQAQTNGQTGTNVSEANPADTTQAAQSTDAQQSGIADIIVTATKRETNLQQTPIAINVLNAQSLSDRHALTLYNLADGSVPSLRVATFEARQSALTIGIRGIVPYDQNQTARDPGVGVYVDGIYLEKSQGLNAALFDIDRIEVLKGPQGTLFGRNTEGGALSLVTKAPTGQFDGRIVGGIGNYGSRNTEIHLDLPEYANLSFKFDGVYEHQDPTVKDPLVGSIGWNAYDRVGGRGQVRWKPTTKLTWDVAVDYARDNNTPNYSQLLNYDPGNRLNTSIPSSPYPVGVYGATSATNAAPRLFVAGSYTVPGTGTPCGGTIATGATTPICIAPKAPLVGVHPTAQDVADVGVPQQYSTDITHGIVSNLKYHFSNALELRSITAWRGVRTDQYDNSGGPERTVFAPSFVGEDITTSNSGKFSRYSLSYLRQDQFSQEVQAVGSIPQLDYAVGGYYFEEHASEYAATPSSNLWNTDGTAYTILSPIPPFVKANGAPVTNTATVNGVSVVSAPGNITSANQGWQPNAVGCVNPVASLGNLCQFVTRDSAAHDHNYSVFGQATFTPAGFDALHFTAGGRWTEDDRHGQLFVVNENLPVVSGTAPNQVLTPVAVPFTFKEDISRFDPLLTLAFDASPTAHLYAKYSTGFRAGGADDRSDTFRAFGPESVKSYEIGAKLDLFDHLARLNLAGYIENRKNTQFDFDYFDTNPLSPTFNSHLEEAINAPGTNHIRGVEADLTVRPTPALTLGGSYAYTYFDLPTAVNPIFGGPPQQLYIVYTPRNAASGSIDYVMPVDGDFATLRLHLDGNYSSSYYSFELENTKTDPSFIVNGRLSLADIRVNDTNRVSISVWTRNLFDRRYVYRRSDANSAPVLNYNGTTLVSANYGGILGDYGNFNPPRTWGVELTAKF